MYALKENHDHVIYKDTELGIEFTVPADQCLGMRQTNDVEPIKESSDIHKAFTHPVSGKTLPEIVREKGARTVSILISDATRGVPTSILSREVIDELIGAGIEMGDIFFFVGIGVHRPATEDEMKVFLGDLYGKVHVENHTPFDYENLVYLGKTFGGTPIEVNRRAYECDLHIQIGKVEPHEFAGFSGGRKSVLPGISSEKTIIINHRPEQIMDPAATIGILDGNPVNQDMTEAAEMFGIDFSINCILNNEMRLAAIFTGGMNECFLTAVDYIRRFFGVCIPRPDVMVVTPGPPLDIDLYQSMKALISVTDIADSKMVLLLYCGCPEGINSPDMLRAFNCSTDLESMVDWLVENYEIQMDHALLLSKLLRKGTRIVLYCPNVSEEDVKTMFMEPAENPEKAMKLAMDLATEISGKENPQVLFYPRPQTGLPRILK